MINSKVPILNTNTYIRLINFDCVLRMQLYDHQFDYTQSKLISRIYVLVFKIGTFEFIMSQKMC